MPFHLGDIVKQLPKILSDYYNTPELVTCDKCGTVMKEPQLKE
jgi:hypothetical protein